MVNFTYAKSGKFVTKKGKHCYALFNLTGNNVYLFSKYHNGWILSLDDKDNIEVRKLLQ